MTPNAFLALAQAFEERGDDLEDIALDLATALKEVISKGLGTENHFAIQAEVAYLMRFSNDHSHRIDKEPAP